MVEIEMSDVLLRALVVEDDPEQLRIILREVRSQVKRYGIEIHVTSCNNFLAAKDGLIYQHFHIVFLDQNLPKSPGGLEDPVHGMQLINFKAAQTLAGWWVYTGHATPGNANIAGLGAVKYRIKSHQTIWGGIEREYADCAFEIIKDWSDNYVPAAFEICSQQLFPWLAEPCGRAAAGYRLHDWSRFFKALADIRSRVVRIFCGFALAVETNPPPFPLVEGRNGGLTDAQFETLLSKAWREIPHPLQAYICRPPEPSKGISTAQDRFFFEAMRKLRAFRNRDSHGGIVEATGGDFEVLRGEILTLLDALAFLCRFPLMHNVHFHPQRRGMLEFSRIGSSGNPVHDSWELDVSPPETVIDHEVYMVWQGVKKAELRLLQPSILARREAGKLQFVLHLGPRPQVL